MGPISLCCSCNTSPLTPLIILPSSKLACQSDSTTLLPPLHMNIYSWESSDRPQRSKTKKAGTVVFHPDEAIDLSFDRLQKEFPLDSAEQRHGQADVGGQPERKKAPLMTPATAKTLVKKMGFNTLLPCQAQCYRGIFNRRDVILHSRTGSGKTLAYALPIIERHFIMNTRAPSASKGPFLLIFLFSNELAAQTKGVIQKIYPKLNVLIAGFDTLECQSCDILIGTVASLDMAIRGRRCGKSHKGVKRTREEYSHTNQESGETYDDETLDDGDDSDSEEASSPAISASNVQAIVVDEVDLTLGPRFSQTGRRMRNLLNFIRKANGSLVKGLLTDYRTHHYVLCGATVPNWVVKAGFLGIKKYYYQLVTVGTAKLPEKLECFSMFCPYKNRVETALKLITAENFGRTVVFGTKGQVQNLETALSRNKLEFSFSTLNPSEDEVGRIKALENFNTNTTSLILCTDVAARGLDFVDVHMVLMLSLPEHNMAVETFVHRAGRTARASRVGKCLQLHDEREKTSMEAIEKNAHITFKKYIASSGEEDGGAPPNKSLKIKRGAPNLQAKIAFSLTVKNPFKYSNPEAAVPTALEVLKKNIGDLFSNVSNVAEGDSPEIVTFEYPATDSHEVRKRLWKFSLKELNPTKPSK
uniref:ATP-dependent RNA helicase n=1 Tax=Trypanosoma congolense (strain IL3000) TaxID=1068625 RepID=G0UVH2_TRYCI|nr:putative ATP-dependent DEAD/H RNA helicase [Trypanosoma congolense IL3000]